MGPTEQTRSGWALVLIGLAVVALARTVLGL
jgi:hypothetical protein